MQKSTWILLIVLVAVSCREKYEVILPPTQSSFLVVEGSIITNGITKIKLSRTTALEEKNIFFELGATVAIESDHNTVFPLIDQDSGRYESPFLNLNEDVKYRINIKTRDNLEYVSDYVQPVKTPDIDTITWTRYNEGIEIFVNANDRENNVSYYRWEYEETWEFDSRFKAYVYPETTLNPLKVTIKDYGTLLFPKYNDTIATCWQFRNSSTLKLGTTTKLSENKVYTPMVHYPKTSWEFSKLYSILIRQYGISKEEYEFLQKMKKNTESLGTIFDAQPTELTGNIRCLNDTTKLIIGYVGVSRVKEKREFIDNKDLIGWGDDEYCESFDVTNHPDSLAKYYYHMGKNYLPLTPIYDRFGTLVAYFTSTRVCIDCTLRGTNKKPSYWP